MNQLKMSVIKEEFDDNLTTPLEGWSFLTGNIVTSSSRPHSTTTTQSVLNQFPPTASTSNHSSTSTCRSFNANKTYPSASVRESPTNGRQGLVKKVETNNRPFIAAHINNKFIPIGSKLQQANTKLSFNFELKQTQEQLEWTEKVGENAILKKNAYEILEKKYDELKLDHFEFKTNANMKLMQLQMDNDKLNDEVNQLKHHQVTLMARINALTSPETSQANARIYIKQEIVDDDSQHSLSLSNTSEMPIKQELSEDDFLSNRESDILSHNNCHLNNSSGSECISRVNENVSPFANEQIDLANSFIDESGHHELIGANGDQQFTQVLQSNDSQANMNEVVNQNDQNADLDDDEEMPNTASDNNVHSVIASNEPSSSAQQQTNRIASKPQTGSNRQNLTKRKRSQSNSSVKRCNKAIEEEDKDEDIANENRIDDKMKVLHLNCTEQNCDAKLDSLGHLRYHLLTAHGLLPFRCFARNCNLRFDDRTEIRTHLIEHRHSIATKFVCHVCRKEFASQGKASFHCHQTHLIGQFQCNMNKCYQVFDTRLGVRHHQHWKHCPTSKRFKCPRDECEASFVNKHGLERHQSVHLEKKPFHCTWKDCSHSTKQLSHLIVHIRMRHFGLPQTLKVQMAKNMVDDRDPNDYVRVVEDE